MSVLVFTDPFFFICVDCAGTDITWKGDGELHFADYNLFWVNIRENFYQRMKN